MSNLKVILQNRGSITLTSHDHISTGGEGSVYKKSGTVVKVYTDVSKMKKDDMGKKIELLSGIKHPYIVAPQGIVLNDQGEEVGYYMPFVNGEPLSRIFTNDFRKREGFTDKDSVLLVDRMRQVVQSAHDYKATMVDANELNWLATINCKDSPIPHVIDVDSWAIDRWPAKVIMPSIRDWHTKGFNQKSDWFAFAVVTFQIFTGIHPYKGFLDGYKPIDLEKRMRDNASVFESGVRLNKAVRDFVCIPGKMHDWYRGVFQKGERSIPPSPFDKGGFVSGISKISRVVVKTSGQLVFDKLFGKIGDPIVRVFPCGVVLLESGSLVDLISKREIAKAKSRSSEVVKVKNGWLKADHFDDQFTYSYISNVSFKEEVLDLLLVGTKLVRFNNRMFLVTDQGLTELNVHLFKKPVLSVGNTWGVVTNSTRWFDGFGIQDSMGAMFLMAPFGEKACAQIRIRELDNLRHIDGKSGNRFVSVLSVDRQGEYYRIELTFDEEYKNYKVSKEKVQNTELNISMLPKGVCATILNDGELDIFVPINGNTTKITDKDISTDMILCNWDDSVVYIKDGDLWKVSLRS